MSYSYKTDYATLDIGAIKVGDEISVRVKVTEVTSGDSPYFNVGRPNTDAPSVLRGSPFWIDAKQIEAHHPKSLAVGDDVFAPDGNGHGVIRAIVDGKAWVRFAPTILETYKLTDLKRLAV